MATSDLRDRDAIALDLVGVVGLTAVAAGLTLLASSDRIGFDAGRAFAGVAGELPTTLPAAILVLGASLIELAAGLVIARSARTRPFESAADALLAGAVGLVLKDLAELSILGQVGLFRLPVLAGVDVAIVAAGWRLRPLVATSWRPSLDALGSLPIAALVGLLWAGPILVQLASPVVPFIDVLPNHVAPAEHLRTFGAFTPLTSTQSPIYGPSRSLLGFTAVLGTVTTLSGLPATLAVAAFVLPATLLVGVAIHRLAVVAAGSAAGPWALLAFALTESFARLSDDRATVVVLPLVAWALAIVIERPAPATWRLPPGVIVGLAMAAAILVHPVIGALALATVAFAGMVRLGPIADLAVTGGVTAAIVAAPQAATMVGIQLPAVAIVAALATGGAAGLVFDRGVTSQALALRSLGWALVIAVPLALVALSPSPEALAGAPVPFVVEAVLLLGLAIVGFVAGVPAARSPAVLAGLAVGFAVAVATQAVPTESLGLLGQALRFELPKTLHYWIPVMASIAAGSTLAWLWRTDRPGRIARVGVVAASVAVAALPLRVEPIDALHLGEHRFAEALAIDLRVADRGFWVGYPDSRELVDGPRREILDAVRAEVVAGRIGPDTPVLHVAGSFQQWVATPLGVFLGVTETDVSPDAEDSIHTVGGRLLHLEALSALLASQAYPYLLLEPSPELPDGLPQQIVEAGYVPGFSNGQGTLYRLGPAPPNP